VQTSNLKRQSIGEKDCATDINAFRKSKVKNRLCRGSTKTIQGGERKKSGEGETGARSVGREKKKNEEVDTETGTLLRGKFVEGGCERKEGTPARSTKRKA